MDQIKTGELIRKLRTEKGLTQKQLADEIGVCDKAVSKWECGRGCPDLSLLAVLSDIFGTDIGTLISGEMCVSEKEGENMKRIAFYVCPECGNVVTSSGKAEIVCCGKKLIPLTPQKPYENESLSAEVTDGERLVTSAHEMTKDHYITFAAFLTDNSVFMQKQYPEWEMQMRIPAFIRGKLIWHCSEHGLFCMDI